MPGAIVYHETPRPPTGNRDSLKPTRPLQLSQQPRVQTPNPTPPMASPPNASLTLLFSSLFISLLIVPSHSLFQSSDDAFTSILVSQNGLDFVKDLLVTKAVAAAVPLRLSDIQKSRKIPFVGNVKMVLSDITIYEIGVSSSYLKPGDSGVAIVASGTTCNLSMNWFYSYTSTWLVPVEVSDKGRASVQVLTPT